MCVLYRNSGTPALYRLLGGSTLSHVADLTGPPTLESPAAWVVFAVNRCIQFNGSVFVVHQDKIHKKDNTTGAFAVAHTISTHSTINGYSEHLGLFVINNAGTPTLVSIFENTGNAWWFTATTDGTTWSSDAYCGATTQGYFARPILYRNVLYWVDHNITRAFDITGPSTTSISTPIIGTPPHSCLCVFQGRLFLLGLDSWSGGTSWKVWELTFGAWSLVHTISAGYGSIALNGAATQAGVLFADGSELIAVYPAQNATAQNSTYAVKLTVNGAGFTETDVTSTVFSSASELLNGGVNTSSQCRFDAVVDDEDSATSPAIHLFYLSHEASGTRTYYAWNGSGSAVGAGVSCAADAKYALASGPGGGERFWTSGDLHIEITGLSTVSTGTQISFKAHGASGSSDKTVKLYFSTSEQDPVGQCTLTGSVTGGSATRNGNQVENVDANGSTTYTCIWDTVTDGLYAGARVTLKATIEP